MFYDRGNRPGFHIFIISARSRNVKYILTENVPVKRFALSPMTFLLSNLVLRDSHVASLPGMTIGGAFSVGDGAYQLAAAKGAR